MTDDDRLISSFRTKKCCQLTFGVEVACERPCVLKPRLSLLCFIKKLNRR